MKMKQLNKLNLVIAKYCDLAILAPVAALNSSQSTIEMHFLWQV